MGKFKNLPGVMSLKRTVIISDVVMLSRFADGGTSPVKIIRHGIRGTQNVNKDAEEERDVSNIQETDTAKLDANAVGMNAEFNIRFLPLASAPDSFAPGKNESADEIAAFRKSLDDFIGRANRSNGLKEVARRYVRNMANGRWLWRNRIMAESVAIHISANGERFDFPEALDISLNGFEAYDDNETKLAEVVEACLRGESDSAINVIAQLNFGVKGAIEIFPSQNYIDHKPKGFARSLYKYGTPEKINKTDNQFVGYAAIRDQKVGNALRTIDTWYQEGHAEPIPVEPNGASLDHKKFFRSGTNSAFKLFLHLDDIDPNSGDGMFCIGCLIRGGVYSGGSEETNPQTIPLEE